MPPRWLQRSCKCHLAAIHNMEPTARLSCPPGSPDAWEIATTAARACDEDEAEKSNVRSLVKMVKHTHGSAGKPCFLKFGDASLRSFSRFDHQRQRTVQFTTSGVVQSCQNARWSAPAVSVFDIDYRLQRELGCLTVSLRRPSFIGFSVQLRQPLFVYPFKRCQVVTQPEQTTIGTSNATVVLQRHNPCMHQPVIVVGRTRHMPSSAYHSAR